MNRNYVYVILSLAVLVAVITTDSVSATYTAIPPTPAFVSIGSNDTDASTNPSLVLADNYNTKLMIVTDGSILVEAINYNGLDE